MDVLSPRFIALFVTIWVVVALLILVIWWALDDSETGFGGDTIDDPPLSGSHFVFCQQCGFYPSDSDERIGVRSEAHANNLATLHRQSHPGHETFVIPGEWVSHTVDTYIHEKFR